MVSIQANSERLDRLLDIYKDEKPLVKWGPEFLLGHEVIDGHHKLIVQYINLLNIMIIKGSHELSIESVFDGLKEYASEHFAYEEAIFEREGYVHTVEHKIEHKIFTAQMDDYFHKYQNGETKMLEALLEYLRTWLKKHILVDDKKYADLLKGNVDT